MCLWVTKNLEFLIVRLTPSVVFKVRDQGQSAGEKSVGLRIKGLNERDERDLT